jgi:NAD+ synthetase
MRLNSDQCIETYFKNKSTLIKSYFEENGIKAVVVGASGGIDSAVVASMLTKMDIEVILVSMPACNISENDMHENIGATGQKNGHQNAEELAKSLGLNLMICPVDVTPYSNSINKYIEQKDKNQASWVSGQIISILRTPMLYGIAAACQATGKMTVVSGTTNRSEGSYIGFFGKASDGMVDIQPISDLWKSEVYALAKWLGNIPECIINATPSGGIWDGSSDEQLMGFTYDYLEKYLEKNVGDNKNPDIELAIESLHEKNSHKYLVGSPAVHFDAQDRHISGGWSNTNTYSYENDNVSFLQILESGNKVWRNKKKQIHRIDGPAVEYANGDKVWYHNHKLHRIDGPAIERINGEKLWYKNGNLHRLDGPAIERANGNKEWWKNGRTFKNKDTFFSSLSKKEKEIALFSEDFLNG